MKLPEQKPKQISASPGAVSIARKFPIVCLGASAGGLEALEQYLGNVPENSGMAFVVIQHLDPTQKGMLPELLQRITKMTVLQVKEKMPVKPNHVYVIPPNKTMTVENGVFHLFVPVEIRGLRLPIDYFLRALANDRNESAVAVILSGMGSDGSLGIRDIKEKNGVVLVQEPSDAKFDSMPLAAIETVVADIVAPADELPGKLVDFLKHLPIIVASEYIDKKDRNSLEKIIAILRSITGNDFSMYKKSTVYRRIERRMGVHKILKISSYVSFLQENPKEVNILFKELLIGVTNFFRDPLIWEKLKDSVLPEMIKNLKEGSVVRAWIPGCSTGEEAFSLAIVFIEVVEMIRPDAHISLQVFATDLDNEAIETARKGIFPANIVTHVSANRLNRFFVAAEEGFRLNSEVREMIVFAKHNIIMHAPFTKIDIITCRNMLIYMDPELQKKLFALFHYSLNAVGILVLGSAETLNTQSHFFTTIDNKLKIYKRSHSARVPELFDFPSSFSRSTVSNIEKQMPAKNSQNIQTLANDLLLQQFSPPGVLVNDKGDIIYTSGRTGKYLEPAVGKANLNIFAMLREGLRNEFPSAFRKVLMNRDTVVLRNISVSTNENSQSIINVTLRWIDKPDQLKGMVMIVFDPLPPVQKARSKSKKEADSGTLDTARLEEELQNTRQELQGVIEEMQTSQEEQKSTNEELQSTNEELQSTNEELTTSKEEMQSLNEELQTMNSELVLKVDDFMRLDNDMKNLLNSTDIATLFLDKNLNIRRFTNQATQIFKLRKNDVGRPFTDLVSDLAYPSLAEDALEVLRTLVFIQKQIPTNDKRWFSIRIMPYRTSDDRIDGLVITFVDNSDIKKLEGELQETAQMHNMILSASSDMIIRMNTDFKILEFNPSAEKFFGKKQKEVLDQSFFKLFVPVEDRKKSEKNVTEFVNESKNGKYKMHVTRHDGELKLIEWNVNILLNNLEIPAGVILFTKTT